MSSRSSSPRRRSSFSYSPDRHERSLSDERPANEINDDGNGVTNVHISNLSYHTTSDDLLEIISPYGKVVDINVVLDPYTKQSRGFGFAKISSRESALALIEQKDKTEVCGRCVRFQLAKSTAPHKPTPGAYMGVSYPDRDLRVRKLVATRRQSIESGVSGDFPPPPPPHPYPYEGEKPKGLLERPDAHSRSRVITMTEHELAMLRERIQDEVREEFYRNLEIEREREREQGRGRDSGGYRGTGATDYGTGGTSIGAGDFFSYRGRSLSRDRERDGVSSADGERRKERGHFHQNDIDDKYHYSGRDGRDRRHYQPY